MKVIAIFAILFLASSAVAQQLYEWVDEKGQRNMTDDPNKVPEKYRTKATTSPGIQASPETIRRAAERRRGEDLEADKMKFHRAAEACAQRSGSGSSPPSRVTGSSGALPP